VVKKPLTFAIIDKFWLKIIAASSQAIWNWPKQRFLFLQVFCQRSQKWRREAESWILFFGNGKNWQHNYRRCGDGAVAVATAFNVL
jgi:hypothetical protein